MQSLRNAAIAKALAATTSSSEHIEPSSSAAAMATVAKTMSSPAVTMMTAGKTLSSATVAKTTTSPSSANLQRVSSQQQTAMNSNNSNSSSVSNSEGTMRGCRDDQQSWPILSANKIGRQKSVICHPKICQFFHPV